MFKRIILLLITKIQSLFLKSLSFSSRIEYSRVSRKAKIWGHCTLNHATVGDYTYIGRNMRVIHAQIGKFCSIAGNGVIGMGTHSLDYISTSSIFTARTNGTQIKWANSNKFDEYHDVNIGNDVWIGTNVLIMGGVRIGNGAVIGAGAVVTKNIPAYAIVGGIPAKLIRYRFNEETRKKLETSKWWLLDEDILRENIKLFQEPLLGENGDKLANICTKNLDD